VAEPKAAPAKGRLLTQHTGLPPRATGGLPPRDSGAGRLAEKPVVKPSRRGR
jgi:hypothetical protein